MDRPGVSLKSMPVAARFVQSLIGLVVQQLEYLGFPPQD